MCVFVWKYLLIFIILTKMCICKYLCIYKFLLMNHTIIKNVRMAAIHHATVSKFQISRQFHLIILHKVSAWWGHAQKMDFSGLDQKMGQTLTLRLNTITGEKPKKCWYYLLDAHLTAIRGKYGEIVFLVKSLQLNTQSQYLYYNKANYLEQSSCCTLWSLLNEWSLIFELNSKWDSEPQSRITGLL